MNKVFKVIWSEARNAYVVVSEMAKNHGAKSCSTKKLLAMLIATGVMTCASMAPAMADNPASDDANKGWNLSVNNGITAGTEVQPGGYVNFNGDEGNIIVSATKEFFGPSVQISLSRNLNVDSIHAGDYFMNNDMGIGFGGDAYITQSGLNANGKVITNVAAGTKATDAVNVGQLNSAVAESGWNLATNGVVTDLKEIKNNAIVNFEGDENIGVSKETVNGVNTVKVELNKDLKVNSVNAGDYFFDAERGVGFGGDAYVTQSGLNANGKVITNVAAGTADTDAVNVGQLNSAVAESGWKLATNGAVTSGLSEIKNNGIVNFAGDEENITVSKNDKDGITTVQVELNKDLKVNQVNAGDYFFSAERGIGFGGDAYITKNGLNANDKVITNVAEGVYNTDAVNVGQLKKVEEVAANANKGWNLSTNGVATEATQVAPGEFVDFSGDKNISVSHDGTKVQVELNKDIDVNSVQTNTVQTNALNAKYNLSVGTANENGTVPFFVNSNGAFYGANGSFVVDKDGNVTAGNVVLNNGVFTGHSALRDAELFVGDADGNYSQITPKSAKLGQVTIDEKGNIAGANSIQTNALNAKYNLSVGTANENGIMPFFVNSNGAFYGANNNFSVDKDGKVIATAGEIGNVVLQNGVYTGHSALRDGELFVGDASG
ncbi:ESPR domain-containing protein, partial [Phascolarctobacterium succinatutens]|uniref:ESPR domain-containing protein n=1 Tax=Phascolarctobacterium succinatutens TaxID=626940 RepID=UPI00307AD742